MLDFVDIKNLHFLSQLLFISKVLTKNVIHYEKKRYLAPLRDFPKSIPKDQRPSLSH
jgi:hypothetical protein